MSWLSSIFVGILAAAAGLAASGFVASLCVGWYRISSFEGGSGYFVLGMALLGGIIALIVGIITARSVASGVNPSFLKALVLSLAIVVGGNGVVGTISYLVADIPPEIDGEELLLAFELQWPAAHRSDPRIGAGTPEAFMRAASGRTVRASWEGALLLEDAHQVDGRWVAPGAVPIRTTRSQRLLTIEIGDSSVAGFLVPLPGRPGTAERRWSEWMPRPKEGAPALPDGFRYRWRVVKQSEPWRVQQVGGFTVETSSSYFYRAEKTTGISARSTFRVSFKGTPIAGSDSAAAVLVVSREPAALLVAADRNYDGESPCVLVVAERDTLRRESVAGCSVPLGITPLTNDAARFAARGTERVREGWLDPWTLATPGLYLLGGSVVDTRTRTLRRFVVPPQVTPDDPPGMLGLSPDERSVVWADRDSVSLGVSDLVAGTSYLLRVDLDRMRLPRWEAMDPAWVQHHFEWRRDAEGHDVLAARTTFEPMPYRGEVTLGEKGAYQNWQVHGVEQGMQQALIDVLVRTLGAEVLPPRETTVSRVLKIDGQEVDTYWFDSGPYVSVSQSAGDPELMQRVARALDEALATRAYDRYFIK